MNVAELPDRICVDASVGLKWVLPEEGSREALALFSGRALLTPSLFWVECGNALATRVRTGAMTADAADDALAALTRLPFSVCEIGSDLTFRARHIADRLRHPIYDCLYLAVAEQQNAAVITADARFARAVAKIEDLASRVIRLDELTFPLD